MRRDTVLPIDSLRYPPISPAPHTADTARQTHPARHAAHALDKEVSMAPQPRNGRLRSFHQSPHLADEKEYFNQRPGQRRHNDKKPLPFITKEDRPADNIVQAQETNGNNRETAAEILLRSDKKYRLLEQLGIPLYRRPSPTKLKNYRGPARRRLNLKNLLSKETKFHSPTAHRLVHYQTGPAVKKKVSENRRVNIRRDIILQQEIHPIHPPDTRPFHRGAAGSGPTWDQKRRRSTLPPGSRELAGR